MCARYHVNKRAQAGSTRFLGVCVSVQDDDKLVLAQILNYMAMKWKQREKHEH